VTLFLGLGFEVPIPVASGAELDNAPMANKSLCGIAYALKRTIAAAMHG
jgi:hypothetical protein